MQLTGDRRQLSCWAAEQLHYAGGGSLSMPLRALTGSISNLDATPDAASTTTTTTTARRSTSDKGMQMRFSRSPNWSKKNNFYAKQMNNICIQAQSVPSLATVSFFLLLVAKSKAFLRIFHIISRLRDKQHADKLFAWWPRKLEKKTPGKAGRKHLRPRPPKQSRAAVALPTCQAA